MTLGAFMLKQDTQDQWQQTTVGNGLEPIRRIVGNPHVLLALTTESLLRSQDNGSTWLKEENAPSAWQILDLTIHQQTLYILLTGGQLWSRLL
jgi:hypothetical protein